MNQRHMPLYNHYNRLGPAITDTEMESTQTAQSTETFNPSEFKPHQVCITVLHAQQRLASVKHSVCILRLLETGPTGW